MKKTLFNLLAVILITSLNLFSQETPWKIVEGRITSEWAENVVPSKVLPDYPRPQMVRENWKNLNGLWDYAILPKDNAQPSEFQGKILVPFAVESALSGVGKTVGKDNLLWYKTSFSIPSSMRGKKLLLHFGGVDWETEVILNGEKVGTHKGGYNPFSFELTPHLKKGNEQELIVKVWDPTDEGPQPRGKQVGKPEGIWYTPVTGIWQTVWIEAVPQTFIKSTKHTPDIDKSTIGVSADVQNAEAGDIIRVSLWDGKNKINEQEFGIKETATLNVNNLKLWSPENPFLYDLKISLIRKRKTIDEISSYTALRKISMEKDNNGIQRMLLNNEFYFQFGPLDQGWWPDGLYTAPSDEALKFDIEKTKEMGFNMIRKHVKVEPARWYYHCDKLGMLVWQDMPSGDLGNRWERRPAYVGLGTEKDRTKESEDAFRYEWNAIMDFLHNFPSIVVWVPFNEAWGQFKTEEITNWTMEKDPSRLVNSASGGNFFPVGHMIDLHNYPEPVVPHPDLFGGERILVLGEYGGLGLPVDGHVWQQKDNWGYQTFKNKEELLNKYTEFIEKMEELIALGLSAAVYTQTTDVEVETNGLMTYDRKVIKFNEEVLKSLHQRLYDSSIVESKNE